MVDINIPQHDNESKDDTPVISNEETVLTETASNTTTTQPIEISVHRSSPRNLSKEFSTMLHISTQNISPISDQMTEYLSCNGNHASDTSASMTPLKSKNNTLYLSRHSIPDQRTPDPDEYSPPALVRSNSYTMEFPSDVFIKHMESQGISLCSELSELSFGSTRLSSIDTISATLNGSDTKDESRTRTQTPIKAPTKPKTSPTSHQLLTEAPVPSAQSGKRPVKTQILNKPKSTTGLKRSESAVSYREQILQKIYGSSEANTRTARPKPRTQLCVLPKTPTAAAKKPKKKVIDSPNSDSSQKSSKSNINEYNRLLKLIEERHIGQMNALVQQQQDAQRRLQVEFSQQQELLKMQISTIMMRDNQMLDSGSNYANSSCYKRSHTSTETLDQSSVCECDDTESDCRILASE